MLELVKPKSNVRNYKGEIANDKNNKTPYYLVTRSYFSPESPIDSVLNVGRHFRNVGRHFVFKPSPPRHPHPHLKWRFEKCRPTFWEKSDMSADIFPKCRPTFWEKPLILEVGAIEKF